MLEALPLEGSHDEPVRVINRSGEAVDTNVQWTNGWGCVYETSACVPPGEHDADELDIFRELTMLSRPETRPRLVELLAPVRVTLSPDIELTRQTVAAGVTTRLIRHDGLFGVLFTPAEVQSSLAVMCLTGSGGGYALDAAGALAAHGFVTFALAYYAVPGLPDDLMEIPLEYLETGINWLANLPDVKGVAVMGRSKGGELALLLGSLFDSIRAIVAYVPSSQTHCWGEPDARKSCWTYKGKPFPYVPMDGSRNPPMENGRLSIRAGYEATIEDPEAADRTAIAVERINCPVLLVSGGEDRMWPSSVFSERIVERAHAHGFEYEMTHLYYPDAGHGIGVPNQPRKPSKFDFFELGGTPQTNAAASIQSWREVVTFLEGQAG